MKLDEALLIIQHPELGAGRLKYAYRYKWFRDAHDVWRDEAEAADKPSVVRVDCSYLEYNTKVKVVMFVDADSSNKYASLDLLSAEDKAADDWCVQKTFPRVVGMARRELITLEFMLTLKDVKKKDKQLIEQLIEELKAQRSK